MPTRRTLRALEPQIVEMPSQQMAVVYTTGDPSGVGPRAFQTLYGSVYALKSARKKLGQDFKVGMPRARWPKPFDTPIEQWTGVWGVPVPDDVTSVPQTAPGMELKLETWHYGTVAQILHFGPYSEEMPTFQRLLDFITQQGYEVSGPPEEEYLSGPNVKAPKTLIQYQVSKK